MKSYLPGIVGRVARLARESGVDYRIMPGNEMARVREGDETQEYADSILREWHRFMVDELLNHGVPGNRIVLSITGANTRDAVTLPILADYPGVIEQVHGPNSPETFLEFANRYPGAELDGDGFDSKALGYKNEYDFSLPSIGQCWQIRGIIKDRGMEYSTFNGYVEGRTWQDLSLAGWAEQHALGGK